MSEFSMKEKEAPQKIPVQLKEHVEQNAGLSLYDRWGHYNRPLPDQLGSLAYTQKNQPVISSNSKHHLPRELWYMVQQKLKDIRVNTINLDNATLNAGKTPEQQVDTISNVKRAAIVQRMKRFNANPSSDQKKKAVNIPPPHPNETSSTPKTIPEIIKEAATAKANELLEKNKERKDKLEKLTNEKDKKIEKYTAAIKKESSTQNETQEQTLPKSQKLQKLQKELNKIKKFNPYSKLSGTDISEKSLGSCLATVYDPKNGNIYYDYNFKRGSNKAIDEYNNWLKEEANKFLLDRINMLDRISKYLDKSKLHEAHDPRAGAHAEVRALNKAIRDRLDSDSKDPKDSKEVEKIISELYLYNINLRTLFQSGEIVTMKRCENCNFITQGINMIGLDANVREPIIWDYVMDEPIFTEEDEDIRELYLAYKKPPVAPPPPLPPVPPPPPPRSFDNFFNKPNMPKPNPNAFSFETEFPFDEDEDIKEYLSSMGNGEIELPELSDLSDFPKTPPSPPDKSFNEEIPVFNGALSKTKLTFCKKEEMIFYLQHAGSFNESELRSLSDEDLQSLYSEFFDIP